MSDRIDHSASDTRICSVDSSGGQRCHDTRSGDAAGGGGRDLPTLLAEIHFMHRLREDLMRARDRLHLQAWALCRRVVGGDKAEATALLKAVRAGDSSSLALVAGSAAMPLLQARDYLDDQKKEAEKRLKKLATQLPVYAWAKEQQGFGDLGLGQIAAEAGDLSNYDNPAKLWKRFGLAVIGGRSQRRVKGAGALDQGFSPRRRSVMYSIGDSFVKSTNSPYREVYLQRKLYEIEKAEQAGLTVRPSRSINDKNRETSRSAGYIHKRAQRYAEKRLLRDLWREWRRV